MGASEEQLHRTGPQIKKGRHPGFAGGGGLSNSMYSNYVRDKGWGMGSRVGAIASAVGKGKSISLSHIGKVFPVNAENLERWKGWWKYILVDQIIIWAPGCFMGMALPALLSIEFAQHSELYAHPERFDWAQAVITADGMRNAPAFSEGMKQLLWLATLFVGLMVLLPAQMYVFEDVSRRWTDVVWSTNRRVRETMKPTQVKWIYYSILSAYFLWCVVSLYVFGLVIKKDPKLMTLIIANLGNLAIGLTAILLLYVNTKYLPKAIRPRWYHRTGLVLCAVFYLGLAVLVFWNTQLPILKEFLGIE
ncbi:MAG: Nramp family divalent metal transporter [Planctomycetes bacterium]|nr:Nramp family divalent metal transporter [Planctomycetota bacterium]